MNDPQIWTLIAAFVGSQGLTLALTMHRIGSLEIKLEAKIGGLTRGSRVRTQSSARWTQSSARFEAVDQRLEHVESTVNAGFDHHAEVMSIRFGAVEQRVGALDDDMKLVKAHLIPPAA